MYMYKVESNSYYYIWSHQKYAYNVHIFKYAINIIKAFEYIKKFTCIQKYILIIIFLRVFEFVS